jgi:hypothetical protein
MRRTGPWTGTELTPAFVGGVMLVTAVMGCGPRRAEPAPSAPPPAFRWESRVGWLHGPCMAISDAALAPGTPVTVVALDDPQSVLDARLGERTTAATGCWPLLEGRRETNTQGGATFYRVVLPPGTKVRLAIGVVEPRKPVAIANGTAEADLDGDGQPETFSECATAEGIRYGVWTGAPYRGVSRWSAYYFMDYEQQADCPPGATP